MNSIVPKITALLSVLTLLLLLHSCNDRDVGITKHYTIKPEIIDYYNWKEGSYWIFRDSLNGKTDSFAVTSYSISHGTTGDHAQYDILYVSIKDFYDTSADYRLWQIRLNSFTASNKLYYFGIPLRFDNELSYDANPYALAASNSTVASVTIGTVSYSNVLVIRANNDEILLNADSGIIKMNLNNQYENKNLVLQKAMIVH